MTSAVGAPCRDIACVIPCYNAGHRVLPVVVAALEQTPRVIVVDDGCTDGCIEPLRPLPVTLLRHHSNRGKGHAILLGIEEALKHEEIGAVALIDADGQHDPSALPCFQAKMEETGAAIVIGKRIFDGAHVPMRSRFGNAVTARVTRLLMGADLPDTQCGYRLLSRGFAGSVLGHVSGGRYETEMAMVVHAIRGHHRIECVPISTVYEPGNASSHFRKVSDSARIYWRLICVAMLSSKG